MRRIVLTTVAQVVQMTIYVSCISHTGGAMIEHGVDPSEIAWHECRQKFWGFAQPSLKGLHLSAGATQHQSCLYARRCVACAHQIAGDLSC